MGGAGLLTAVNIKLLFTVDIVRDLRRLNITGSIIQMTYVFIKMTGAYCYLDSYPKDPPDPPGILWPPCFTGGAEVVSLWLLHIGQRCVFSCYTGQHQPLAARPQRSERFSCGGRT